MHGIKVWCPHPKQVAVGKKTPDDVPSIVGLGGAGSSSAVAPPPAPGLAGSSSNADAEAAKSDEPPAKRQRIDNATDQPAEEVAAKKDDASASFCAWEGSYGDPLATHLKKECQFHKIPCPLRCGAEVRRGDMELHMATACPRSFEECSICGLRVRATDMTTHHEESALIHVSILEKQNKELKVQKKDLSVRNAHLMDSILPQLQTLTNTTATKSDVAAAKNDLKAGLAIVAKASEDRATVQARSSGTSDPVPLLLPGRFEATWSLNVTNLFQTCTAVDDFVQSEDFTPAPQKSFRIRVYPHGYGGNSADRFCVVLWLRHGASWREGEVDWGFQVWGRLGYVKHWVSSGIVSPWSENQRRHDVVFSPEDALRVRNATNMKIVVKHREAMESKKFTVKTDGGR